MMKTKRTLGVGALVVSAWLAAPAAVLGQNQPTLGNLSLEELLGVRVQPVFGASERLQPVSEAPATVTIVTAAEITRYGYRTVAEILRGVAGFHVTDDRNYSYVGVRAVGIPGDYNSRVLLLLNGHKVNDNVYDQAFIGRELGLDVAMVERVEVIRGPASSLYGTSAFFAVINIVTRSGASLDGAAFEAAVGTPGGGTFRGSFGRRFDQGVDLIVSGTIDHSRGNPRLYFPAFAESGTHQGIAENLDGEEVASLYGRVAARNLTLTGSWGRRLKYVPTASFFTIFNSQEPRERTVDSHAIVDAQYDAAIGETRLAADLSFDRWAYAGVYPFTSDTEASSVLINDDSSVGIRWSGGVRVTRMLLGGQTLTAGTEVLANVAQRQTSIYDDSAVPWLASDESSYQTAVYVQDEIRVRPWLLLNGGIRHDRYEQFARTTPRGAVILLPSVNQSVKYLYGRAFRAPNAYERYYYAGRADALHPESVATHELAWEAYIGEWLRTSVSAYRSDASELIALDLINPHAPELVFINRGAVTAKGVALEGEIRSKNGLHAAGHLSLQAADDEFGTRLTNAPGRMASLRLSAPGPIRGAITALELRYTSPRQTPAGTTVPAVTLADLTVTAPMTPSLELFGSVRNLFGTEYTDPASEEHVMDAIPQNGRTARIGLRWHLFQSRKP